MRSLRGSLLLAGPTLVDPNFRRTVVLIGEHGPEGAMGLVLNRPSDVTVEDAVEPLADLAGPGALVHVGGPVQEQAVVVLAEFDDLSRAASLVTGTIGFVPGEVESVDALGPLGAVRVYAGYAGWAPGQLESELAEDAWIVEPATRDDVFTTDPKNLWSTVLRRRGGAFAVLALMPEDPRVN